ncbi:latent-transforming growth factor beta-binding protein 4-like isoform X2 [Liolophura sinensis]|uniref:latent-transforming growth factor beta-binding protein 4-like isoform X2 n=1 Tax=Liolophura sinensis TaxID=3198878 RepID=UPI00315884BE
MSLWRYLLVISFCMVRSKTGAVESVYEGCYGIDLLISKVPIYTPSQSCWEQCRKKGTQQVLVYGVRWCGCHSNGMMGPGSVDCELGCTFLPNTDCVCFHGHSHDYDRSVQLLVHKHIAKLPPTKAYRGYNCINMPAHEQTDIDPVPAQERAHKCVTGKCRHENRQYGAYMMGYKCGCKKSLDPLDDGFLPVTKDCMDRMVCMELPESVCLCGNTKLDSVSSSASGEYRPLLVSDRFQCYLMKEGEEEAEVKRIVEYEIIRKNRAKPSECLDICIKEEYRFAGVSRGGVCACQNHIGHKKLSDDDCFSPCLSGRIGCGGPYAASVYSFKGHIELNECRGNTHDCDHVSTNCVNTANSYRCECRVGFRHQNRTHCLDVDECRQNNHECDYRSTYCVNTIGGFLCECNAGYERFDRTHCEDIDECSNHQNDCGEYTKCINTIGSFRCDCVPGFNMIRGDCKDVDECADNMNDCERTSTFCKNTIGGFVCECRVGYQPLDRIRCKDIDECYSDTSEVNCGIRQRCRNSIGSYICVCVPGYQRAGDRCRDIDECLLHTDDCDHVSSECVNTAGSFHCVCKTGYQRLDRTRCVDIDECQIHRDMCVRCTNTMGSYMCDCHPGYQLSTQGCIDIDECHQNDHACSVNSDCQNNEGSYICNCKPGYTNAEGSETKCVDVDECLHSSMNGCHDTHSSCENTDGSYNCPCDHGFMGDGRSKCTDIDECHDGHVDCAEHAKCTNLIGSYTCDCKPGYSGNGKICGEVITLEDLETLLDDKPNELDTEPNADLPAVNEMSYSKPTFQQAKPDRTELELLFGDIKEPPNGMTLEDMLRSLETSLPKVSHSETDAEDDTSDQNQDQILDEIVDHQEALVGVTKFKNIATEQPRASGHIGIHTDQSSSDIVQHIDDVPSRSLPEDLLSKHQDQSDVDDIQVEPTDMDPDSGQHHHP